MPGVNLIYKITFLSNIFSIKSHSFLKIIKKLDMYKKESNTYRKESKVR